VTGKSDLGARARVFADQAYRDVDDGGESLGHCREVAALLAELGCEEHVVAAGLLHDVVEDTAVAIEEVRAAFGDRVGDLVAALTEDAAVQDYRRRKLLLRTATADAGHVAMVIFAADKLARVRAADRAEADIAPLKLEHYRRSSEMFAANGVRTPHAVELEQRLRLRRDDRVAGPVALA
jgi:(p)ppGpp synthase/HD superfamily hydrolase